MESMATDTYRTFQLFMSLMTYVKQKIRLDIFLYFVKVMKLKTFAFCYKTDEMYFFLIAS